MKKVWKVILIIIVVIVVTITGLIAYVKTALPNIAAAEDLKIDYTQERIARGEYLANHVTMCIECHSERDFTTFTGPVVPGSQGKGGELFGKKMGFPGDFYAPNITPTGIGNWTDGELFRTITTGVSKDGHALFPIMPYPNFGQLDKEDIFSIIAYIRTLKPIESNVPKSVAAFPINILINTMPNEASFTTIPPKEELVAYGKYIFTASNCNDCHTPMDKGERIADKFVAGGMEFNLPNGTVLRSANITPDKLTGIGAWTEKQFIARFKLYSDSTYVPYKVGQGEFNTLMPWSAYTHMDEHDLKALFAYLQTVPAVDNKVIKFEEREKTE